MIDWKAFSAEMMGTLCLVLVGNGSIAFVTIKRSKGYQAGKAIPVLGFALGLYTGLACCQGRSDGHLNPAITIARCFCDVCGILSWQSHLVGEYLLGQVLGAFLGQVLVYLSYLQFFTRSKSPLRSQLIDRDFIDEELKVDRSYVLATRNTFCTNPADDKIWLTNILNEFIGTMLLSMMAVILSAQ